MKPRKKRIRQGKGLFTALNYIHLILFGISLIILPKNTYHMPIKQALPAVTEAHVGRQTHNMTSCESLTALYTAETAGAKIRSSRGCCPGPLGILQSELRVRDLKSGRVSIRENHHHRMLSMTQPLSPRGHTLILTETGK